LFLPSVDEAKAPSKRTCAWPREMTRTSVLDKREKRIREQEQKIKKVLLS
jgi:hypothetical protein